MGGRGALIVGGAPQVGSAFERGLFFSRTLIDGADDAALVMTQENYGPIAAVRPSETTLRRPRSPTRCPSDFPPMSIRATSNAHGLSPSGKAAFNEAFAAADSLAAQRLQTIGKLHQARIARLTREAAGLARQGDAGTASLAEARAEIAAEKITVAKAAMLNQRAATADPQVSPSGWALHGRVYSSELAPVAGCTVFLVDPQNAFQSAYGFAYTDASGYFVLNGAATGAPAHGGAATQLYVAVADAKGEPVYRSSTAFTPNPGVATYQMHVLPAGGKPIGDPPPEIRNIALPKT